MKEINYKELANNLMFEISDDEISEVQTEFEVLFKQIELLNKIDTQNTLEMVYPFEFETSYLRSDDHIRTMDLADVLSNAPKTKQGHFVVPKVVK